jgi:HlyD family secretion protein
LDRIAAISIDLRKARDVAGEVGQARAAVDAATASRDNVYAGVRAEQIAALAAEVAKAKSKLTYLEAQLVSGARA